MIVSPTVGGVIVAIVAFHIVTLPDVQSERGGSRFAAEDRKLDRLHPSCLFVCLFCKKRRRVQTVQPVGNEASKLG